jgi:hypothetical protein
MFSVRMNICEAQGVIVGEFRGMRDFTTGGIMASSFPKAEMLQDFLDDRLVLYHADNPHFALALGTYQGISLTHQIFLKSF